MSPSIQLDLHIEVDVLTPGSTAEVVIAILESLLFQRNQIPFVYKTYRYYVNKWLEDEEKQLKTGTILGIHHFHALRQKDNAKMTKDSISAMREAIKEIFEKKTIKCLRFLFGATAFTPKESYTIHIPTESILMNHCYEHHRLSTSRLNHTLLSLLTSEDLYAIFSNNLNPTNVYLELEVLENPFSSSMSSSLAMGSSSQSQIFPKDFTALPPSCKDINIHLIHKRNVSFDDKQLKCCKDLQIFEDINALNLEADVYVGKNDTEANSTMKLADANTSWWESQTVVRGFKEKPIKGFNLWS